MPKAYAPLNCAQSATTLALALFVGGCASQLEVTPAQTGCTDFNYSDPADPVLEWEATGDNAASVWRANVLLDQAGATFAPEFAIDNGTLSVIEHWTDPASDDTFCYQPELALTGIRGKLDVLWFTEDDLNVPWRQITVEP